MKTIYDTPHGDFLPPSPTLFTPSTRSLASSATKMVNTPGNIETALQDAPDALISRNQDCIANAPTTFFANLSQDLKNTDLRLLLTAYLQQPANGEYN